MGVVAGQGARGGGRLSGLIERLRPLLTKLKGLQRAIKAEKAAVTGAEEVVQVAKTTVRPRATPSQLREMLGKRNYFVWMTTERDSEVAMNQTVRFTGQNTPKGAPEGVYLSKFQKSNPVNCGNFNVAIDGSKYNNIKPTGDGLEFRLDGEIPANDGVWFTREDYNKLSGGQ